MIFKLALKSLALHPVRALVLGVGFGLGVGVMATLLGVGEVVLDQAKEPALIGGGDVIATGFAGAVTSARFVMASLPRASAGTTTASPRKRADLFLIRPGKDPLPIHAHAGIPSLERALGDPETSPIPAWQDTAADAAWSSPKLEDVLRAMDRFHPVPDVAARASSWAEWLYFKGPNFYCTFLAGPKNDKGMRLAGVRLQLYRGGRVTSFDETAELDEAVVLGSAPNLTIGNNHVRLEGLRYHITLNLPGASGDFFVDAVPGRQLAPLVIRGAGGWVSGYTVPVMSGPLGGWIQLRDDRLELDGTGYHDHNWGFWQGVSWRWGQVQHDALSYVYGRVFPPADAADPERIPGFLIALGPDGPLGYSTSVAIRETDDPTTGRPQRIVVSSHGGALDLTMDITVEDAIVTPGGALASGPDFLQLRARYRVTGKAGGQPVDFTGPGAAETFRGR
jgi:hypothetical protein